MSENVQRPPLTIFQEAGEEVAKELRAVAKSRLKESLHKIANAKKVLANLELEHAGLVMDIAAEDI